VEAFFSSLSSTDANKKTPCILSEGFLPLTINSGDNKKASFKLYAGPKERAVLKKFNPTATKIMHLGWNWLEPLSQLLLSLLIFFNKFLGNYGISIIFLTILVRAVFWPISQKANASMKKMQKMQPIIQEVKNKYKNDPQKMNTKVMALYKEHGVNPLGGCLPILLQIPVFFALYNALNGAIELRQTSFLWAADLSRPDTIWTFPWGGLPLNPLAIAMATTMFLQQKMTPSGAADPMQQKMLMMMPFIMLIMLYNLPSGLTLYWTVSQIISIAQLLINKYKSDEDNQLAVKQSPIKQKI
jgi:YidC/Oxa1 family membrane protein insertase